MTSDQADYRHPASVESNATGKEPGGVAVWLRHSVPTALILGSMLVLAWWGHDTGWKFSKSNHPTKETAVGVLVETSRNSYGWCAEHGVHECPLHHPDAAQTVKRVSVTPGDFDRVQRGLAVRKRAENDPDCMLPRYRIRFPTAEAVEKTGIDISVAWQGPLTESVTANGEVIFDPTRTAKLASRVAGTARRVAKKTGDVVHAGEILALVDAAEVGKAKSEFVQALVQVRLKIKAIDNLRRAAQSISPRQFNEAEAAKQDAQTRLLAAEQALANLGLSIHAADYLNLSVEEMTSRMQFLGLPDSISSTLNGQLSSNFLPVRAPFDGLVLSTDVIPGEVVEAGKVLFVVIDPREMWLTLHIGMEDARLIRPSQNVGFHPAGGKETFTGKINWVGTAADEKTRLVPARAMLDNRDGRLRASTLGMGRIVLREEPGAIVVPNEAVHIAEDCQVIFVRHKDFLSPDGPKEFIARSVRTGAKNASNTEILVGLLPGEVVAAKGSGVLLDELKKSLPTQRNTRTANLPERGKKTP